MADNRSTFHQGQATKRNVDSASARVGFDDLDKTVSGLLQVLFPAAGGWNFFYTPKEGDQVVVSRLPNGTEEGYIIGKVYTANKMPQGGADNIILIISDDGKNVIRFDADKGTLDLIVDQTGTEKFNNLDTEVKENRTTKIGKNRETEIGIDDDLLIDGNQKTIVAGNSLHVSANTDIESDAPVGIEGTNVKLGSGVLRPYWKTEKAAWEQYPIIIPPIPWPAGVPVPPAPPIINMALNGIKAVIIAADEAARASSELSVK